MCECVLHSLAAMDDAEDFEGPRHWTFSNLMASPSAAGDIPKRPSPQVPPKRSFEEATEDGVLPVVISLHPLIMVAPHHIWCADGKASDSDDSSLSSEADVEEETPDSVLPSLTSKRGGQGTAGAVREPASKVPKPAPQPSSPTTAKVITAPICISLALFAM